MVDGKRFAHNLLDGVDSFLCGVDFVSPQIDDLPANDVFLTNDGGQSFNNITYISKTALVGRASLEKRERFVFIKRIDEFRIKFLRTLSWPKHRIQSDGTGVEFPDALQPENELLGGELGCAVIRHRLRRYVFIYRGLKSVNG